MGRRGKRKGVYGAYLLAVRDEESEEFQSISKIGTGFDEKQLIDFHAALKPTVIDKPRAYYRCVAARLGARGLCETAF